MRCQRTHIFFTFHFAKAILEMVHRVFHALPPQQKAFFKDACLGKRRVEAGNIGAAALSSLGGIPIGYASLPFRASARFKGGPFSSMYSGARRPATGSMAPPFQGRPTLRRSEWNQKRPMFSHVTAPLWCTFLLQARAKDQLCMFSFQFNRAGRISTF